MHLYNSRLDTGIASRIFICVLTFSFSSLPFPLYCTITPHFFTSSPPPPHLLPTHHPFTLAADHVKELDDAHRERQAAVARAMQDKELAVAAARAELERVIADKDAAHAQLRTEKEGGDARAAADYEQLQVCPLFSLGNVAPFDLSFDFIVG